MSLLEVQRELNAVKAERRIRQRVLYTRQCAEAEPRIPSALTEGSRRSPGTISSSTCWSHERSKQNALTKPTTRKTTAEQREYVQPYHPESALPPQLLRMVYVSDLESGLTPCPTHKMGKLVGNLDLSPWKINANLVDMLIRENSQLSALKISGRDDIGDHAMQGLSDLVPQLASMELSSCLNISARALGILIHSARRLNTLNLSGCQSMGDEHVVQVARGCPSLTTLDLSQWPGLTDAGLVKVASSGKFASLKRLLLSQCPGVGDAGIRATLDGCQALEELSAGGCNAVTGRAFLGMELAGGAATAPVFELKRLELPNCRRLSAPAVVWIAAGCTSLESLNVSGCASTSPEGVELLAATPPELLNLGIAGCVRMTNTALSFVANHGASLQHLDISDIPGASARVVRQFLRICKILQSLGISGLSLVDESSFRGLAPGDINTSLDNGGRLDKQHDCHQGHHIRRLEHGSASPDATTGYTEDGTSPGRLVVNEGLQYLRVARMLRLPNLDDSSVTALAAACPGLQELLLSDSPMVTGSCLAPLSFCCPLLRSLALDRCRAASDEAALLGALQQLSNLRDLRLAREGFGVDDGTSVAANGRGTSIRSISKTSLSSTSSSCGRFLEINTTPGSSDGAMVPRGSSFTGAALVSIARCCAKMTRLGLEGHDKLVFVESFAPPCAFPCLRELRLADCSGVDDSGLQVLLTACPCVSTLSLQGSRVSQQALVEASTRMRFVEVVPPPRPPCVSPSRRSRKDGRGALMSEKVAYQMDVTSGLVPPAPPVIFSRGSSPFKLHSEREAGECLSGSIAPPSRPTTRTTPECAIGEMSGRDIRATGLQPSQHAELYLTTTAVFTRLEKERFAARRLSRTLQNYRHRQLQRRVVASRRVCRAALRYRIRTSRKYREQRYLFEAKIAAILIQRSVRAFLLRKWSRAAIKIQALWKRYSARCVFLHQRRLRQSAMGFQGLWRGYHVRTRLCVREKIMQLRAAKKMIGPKWFKGSKRNGIHDEDDAKTVAQQRDDMQDGIRQARAVVLRELQSQAHKRSAGGFEEDDRCRFGEVPPAPRRDIVQGSFDSRPHANRLRDGREVHFEGVAQQSCSNIPSAPRTIVDLHHTGAQKTPCDPADFDVFRPPGADLWQGQEDAKRPATREAHGADKERTLCGLCKRRFAAVSCKECRRGYCFRCSEYTHSQTDRKGHDLGPFQRPELLSRPTSIMLPSDDGITRTNEKKGAVAAAARSLPDNARRAGRFMKNMGILREKEAIRADEQRAKMKLQDRKELEAEEERQKLIDEQRMLASAGEQNAASTIQKACRDLMEKLSSTRELEIHRRAKIEGDHAKKKELVTRIQAVYRGYSVRAFFLKASPKPLLGIPPRDGGGRGGARAPTPPPLSAEKDKATPALRVRRDCAFRRRWEREVAIAELKRLESDSTRMFAAGVQLGLNQHRTWQARLNTINSRLGSARSTRTRLLEEQSLLDPELAKYDSDVSRIIKVLELQELRVQHQSALLEVAQKGVYWCRTFIRQLYRRQAAQTASMVGADSTFAWLEEELFAINEMVGFCATRLESVADVQEEEFFRGWLSDQIARAGKQRLTIDLEQEFVLEEETGRIARGNAHASKCQEILKELLNTYIIGIQFCAERCGAELATASAIDETDDKFLWISRATILKDKEERVQSKVQEPLQLGLEEEIATEERELSKEVKLVGDAAEAPISDFTNIKASLVEPPHHPSHLSFESWKKVYRAQPWLAAQSQAENKRKATRAATIEELEEMRAVVATAKSQEMLVAKEASNLRATVEEWKHNLSFKGDVRAERMSDTERIRLEIDLKKAEEKLVDLDERVELRRKANASKESELKIREDALEKEITEEERRHVRQADAMAAFRVVEHDDVAAQYGKEEADATVAKMRTRLEKLKSIKGDLHGEMPRGDCTDPKPNKRVGVIENMVNFALGKDGMKNDAEREAEKNEIAYSEQANLIAKKAKLAMVNRQIADMEKAKNAIANDFTSPDAQLMLAENAMNPDDGEGETAERIEKLQVEIREAKQRAKEAKARDEAIKRQQKKEAAEQRAAEAKRKHEEMMARRFADEMGMGGVGNNTGMLGVAATRIKSKVQGKKEIYGGAFESEKAAIEAAIKAKHKSKLGKVEAVVGFAFTVGSEETDAMASKQARLASQGLPSYRKMTKGLGGKEAVFLWIAKSLDSQEFITELQITHADPGDRRYKNLAPYGFTAFGHPKLAAKGSDEPSIIIWGKRDPHSNGIADVELSYSQLDEKKLTDVGFKVAPGALADFGLPDVRLWYSAVKRGAHTLPPVKAILHDLGEIRNMRKQNPIDVTLQDTESRLESKLAQAREAEEQKAKDAENPLKSAIETYALTASDVDAFIAIFGAMDIDRTGMVDSGEFFEYLEWPRNTFGDHLFSFMEAADDEGGVDFGDFVKLVCSYCMFGKEDLLRYAYTVYDQGRGFVSTQDLMCLLNDIHKTNPGPVERALRDADIEHIGQLQFRHFLDLDRRFPKMFYPVANLQIEMRKNFLGEAYWTRKMHIFNEVRENIIKTADGTASRARKAKLREEELAFVKEKAKKVFAIAKQGPRVVNNRVRDKIEKSKWLSKLLS